MKPVWHYPTIILIVWFVIAGVAPTEAKWRLGIEYTEETCSAPLMNTLSAAYLSQDQAPGINFDFIGGGWYTMQAVEDGPIDFSDTDAWVACFQAAGFALQWNLRCDAPWASAGNPDCINGPDADDCAPDADHWTDWYDYVYAIVERYNLDGEGDMPGLTIPVRTFVMQGEIVWSHLGGDDAEAAGQGSWDDTVANLLEIHRVAYQAMTDADGTGQCRLVASGAVLWDLYNDFPEYPAFDFTAEQGDIYNRLSHNNIMNVSYLESWQFLKDYLEGLSQTENGPFCDYIGWRPLLGWRGIEQSFSLIRNYAGDYPIYIDHMYTNIFSGEGGYAHFIDEPSILEGDFPNVLAGNYNALRDLLKTGDTNVTNWYYGKQARRLTKSIVSALGEGAGQVCISGSNDTAFYRTINDLSHRGWINLLGTSGENYREKPGYRTLKLLAEHLKDFTSVSEVDVHPSPYTRVYRFERPRGPLFVMWSEEGSVPAYYPDESPWTRPQPNGYYIEIPTGRDRATLSSIIPNMTMTGPERVVVSTPSLFLKVLCGYEPMIAELTWVSTMLNINSQYFRGGDTFSLSVTVDNQSVDLSANLFVILDVYGSYFFWDDWSDALDFMPVSLTAFENREIPVLEFVWPTGVGSGEGLWFWSALVTNDLTSLVGDLDSVEFSFGD